MFQPAQDFFLGNFALEDQRLLLANRAGEIQGVVVNLLRGVRIQGRGGQLGHHSRQSGGRGLQYLKLHRFDSVLSVIEVDHFGRRKIPLIAEVDGDRIAVGFSRPGVLGRFVKGQAIRNHICPDAEENALTQTKQPRVSPNQVHA